MAGRLDPVAGGNAAGPAAEGHARQRLGAMKRAAGLVALLAGACASQPVAVESAPPPVVAAAAPAIANGDQWLYGSAEGSVATRQAFKALTDYAVRAAHNHPQSSVILD